MSVEILNHAVTTDVNPLTKRVLLLGAGYVSAPVVEYLTRNRDVSIYVASALQDEAENLAKCFPQTEPVVLNVTEQPELLEKYINKADVVISLLPNELHPIVAEQCIKFKSSLVTASYLSSEMKQLHEKAVEAGITVVNEIGLDPGIDHLLAMECFDEVHLGGGKVNSFISYCGGLPAPECSDNPLRYRFSWTPRRALLNTVSGARYLKEGKIFEIEAGGKLLEKVEHLDFLPGFAFEGVANRDSTEYIYHYNIGDAHTVFRGTLRFQGHFENVLGLIRLGFINPEPLPCLHPGGPDITWRQLTCSLLGIADCSTSFDNLKSQVFERVGGNANCMNAIEELGLLSDELVVKCGSPVDTISHYLARQLAFGPSDRDMVVLHHQVCITWPDQRRETRNINLITYGKPGGFTAMACTVGYPVAMTARMILDGEIQRKGMILPLTQDIYHPILERLKAEGIIPEKISTFN